MSLTKVPYEMQKGDITEDTTINVGDFNNNWSSIVEYLNGRRIKNAHVTILFPVGVTDMGNQSLTVSHIDGNNISIEGSGKDNTIVRFSNLPSASGWAAIDIRGNYTLGNVNKPGIDKLTLDGNNWSGHNDGGPNLGNGDQRDPMGIKARDGAVIYVGQDVRVEYFARNGIFCYASANITANNIEVNWCGSDAFSAAGSASLIANGATANENWGVAFSSDGASFLWADNTVATNTKDKFDGLAGQNYNASNYGRMFARNSRSENSAGAGYIVSNGGQIRAEDSVAINNGVAASAPGYKSIRGSYIAATGAEANNNSGHGFEVDLFGAMDCSGCKSLNNGKSGLAAFGCSNIIARDLAENSINGNGAFGMITRNNSSIDATGVNLTSAVTANTNGLSTPLADSTSGIEQSVIYGNT